MTGGSVSEARRPHHRHIGGQPIGDQSRQCCGAGPRPDKAGRKRCATASETVQSEAGTR